MSTLGVSGRPIVPGEDPGSRMSSRVSSAVRGRLGAAEPACYSSMATRAQIKDPTTSEKVRTAERQIALVRLFVVSINSAVYAFLMDKAGTVPFLAYTIIALALPYAAWTLWRPPAEGGGPFVSSYFTSTSDALLIVAWIYATGGINSPFHLLLYISVVAVAFRYELRETVVAAIIYVASYVGLLAALGQISGHGTAVLVRSPNGRVKLYPGGVLSAVWRSAFIFFPRVWTFLALSRRKCITDAASVNLGAAFFKFGNRP